jgi:ribosome-binding protein aMBF1 (putative translation factor)
LRAADSRSWRHMQKSLGSPEYERLVKMLFAARKKAGIQQETLAKKLETPALTVRFRSGAVVSGVIVPSDAPTARNGAVQIIL